MRKHNRYTRSYGQPNFYRFRVITARFSSNCKCGANIQKGNACAYASRFPAICMECYRAWEFEVQQEDAICNYNQQVMGGSW